MFLSAPFCPSSRYVSAQPSSCPLPWLFTYHLPNLSTTYPHRHPSSQPFTKLLSNRPVNVDKICLASLPPLDPDHLSFSIFFHPFQLIICPSTSSSVLPHLHPSFRIFICLCTNSSVLPSTEPSYYFNVHPSICASINYTVPNKPKLTRLKQPWGKVRIQTKNICILSRLSLIFCPSVGELNNTEFI